LHALRSEQRFAGLTLRAYFLPIVVRPSYSAIRGLLHVGVAAGLVLAATLAFAQTPPKPHPAEAVPYPSAVAPHAAVVVLELTISAKGVVEKVTVTSKTPDDVEQEYVDTAVRHAETLTFDPALGNDGLPIRSRIPYTVRFPAPPAASALSASSVPSLVPSAIAAPKPSTSTSASAVAPSASASVAPAKNETSDKHDDDETMGFAVHGYPVHRPHGVSYFDQHLGAQAIVPHKNATALLPALAPGILLTNEGGEGHAEQIFLRGFDAREGQDIEFSVDGIPANDVGNLHGNGHADLHFIIPELVASLRVLEGPYDPKQGNFAVAGSADYELGLEARGLTTKFTTGSFGTNRLLLLWGPPSESVHTFGGVELFKTDGFGMNRSATRGTAMGQYESDIGKHGTFRIIGTAYATTYHSAGLLRQDDYDAGRIRFFDTYDPLQGGESTRFSIGVDYETVHRADPAGKEEMAFRHQLFVIRRTMNLRENFTGFLLDVQQPFQNPHGQRGDLLDLMHQGWTLGARGSARYRTQMFGLTQELELGYFARADDVAGTQYRVEAATGHPYHLDTDISARLADIGAFLDANLKFTKWLTVRGGVRADVFTFNVLDNCAVSSVAHPAKSNPPGDASCLSQQAFGAYREPVQRATTATGVILPRASLMIGPIQNFTIGASYGRGIRSIDPIYVSQDADTPFAAIESYEGGVSYAYADEDLKVTARSVFFRTHVARDLLFSETEGRNVLGGGTTRTGWLGALRIIGSHIDQVASVTLVRSAFDDDGLLVPYVPDVVGRSDTAFFTDLPLTLSGSKVRGLLGSGITYVGHRPLPYGQRSDILFLVDATAALRWKGYELGLSITNLLGTRYKLGEYNFASDFHDHTQPTLVPMRHFTAGAPRAVYLSLSATLGGS